MPRVYARLPKPGRNAAQVRLRWTPPEPDLGRVAARLSDYAASHCSRRNASDRRSDSSAKSVRASTLTRPS